MGSAIQPEVMRAQSVRVCNLKTKSLRGNWFSKGHRDIAEKASHNFEKASIPLKIYLTSLAILEISQKSLQK
jgi:hypothetical protein